MSDPKAVLDRLGIDPQKILAALDVSSEPSTIFLSGSIIEGYGNAESDLDVFLIYPDALPTQGATYAWDSGGIAFEYLEDWRLDIEMRSEKKFPEMAQRLNACPTDDWNACLGLAEWEIELSHRIRVGVPIRDEEHFWSIHRLFDFDHISRLIATRCLISHQGVSEDASGAILSKQHGTALLMARRALQYAVDAVLAFHGETNLKEKWRFFKLMKLGDTALLDRYWALETKGIGSPEEALAYAKECLLFANQLVLKLQKAAA